jgi:hypothetical protein
MATQTVTGQQTVTKQPETVVFKIRAPEPASAQAEGSWVKTVLGVALLGAALYGAYQMAPSMGNSLVRRAEDQVFSLGQRAFAYLGLAFAGWKTTEATVNAAAPRIGDALVNAGANLANRAFAVVSSASGSIAAGTLLYGAKLASYVRPMFGR